MPRIKTRTARLSPEETPEVRRLFGTVMNAYRQLMPGGQPLTWAVFRAVAGGSLVRPSDVETFRIVLREWRTRNLRTP